MTLLTTDWRNGGDYVKRFTAGDSPFVSTITRRLGAVEGVVYDADGRARDIDGDTPHARPSCTTLEPPATADGGTEVSALRERAVRPERFTIDLMELYTLAAENGAGGQAQIEAKIAAAVDLLNTALLQSKIYNVDFRLVYVGRVDRDENLTQMDLLSWLTNDPGVGQLRAAHGADLVGLWTEADAEIAWAPRKFTASSGFHVISRRYPLSLHLFSHEVAHNLGAQHNAEQLGAMSGDPYPYARGLVTSKWMTIMGYPPPGEWRDVVPLFSTPELTYGGAPLGAEGIADNARMIRLAGPIVAGYYAHHD